MRAAHLVSVSIRSRRTPSPTQNPVTGGRGLRPAPTGPARRLEELYAEASTAFPALSLPRDAFASYVSERLSEGDPSLPLANVDAPGLYLACACALGVRGAVELADAICSTHVISALRRLGIESTLRDEVLARLRTMLFAGSAEGGPLLLAFKGRGTLRSWVHSVAVHQALKLRRSDRPLVSIEQLATDLVDSRSDPEMAYLKIFYLEEFRAALHRAMTAIPKDARNLLRQHYLDRMSLEAVAQVHRVHRATAARWLSEARRHVLDKTKEELTLALELHPSEVDSILSFVRRQSSFGDHLSGVGLALSDT